MKTLAGVTACIQRIMQVKALPLIYEVFVRRYLLHVKLKFREIERNNHLFRHAHTESLT